MRALGNLPDPMKKVAEDYSASEVLRASLVPARVSNRDLVRILDQGGLGSCTANAALQCVRASQLMHGAPVDVEFGSRLFAYFFARTNPTEDSGTWLRAVFEALNKFGFPPESVWPYDDNPDPKVGSFAKQPGMRAMRASYDQVKPTEYRRIYETGEARLQVIKRALAQRQLVCFGTDVTERFCSNGYEPGEVIMPPEEGEPIAGGHAMAIAGYDGNEFDIVNSWGTDFGDQGFCTFDGSYLTSPVSRDFWIVRSAPRFERMVEGA